MRGQLDLILDTLLADKGANTSLFKFCAELAFCLNREDVTISVSKIEK